MSLVRVEVRTIQGSLLTLPLDDVSNGLIVEEVDGLDPVKATLVSSSFAGADGEQYHSSRRESRNIKLKLGLESDFNEFSVRDLRQRLYQFFMPKSAVMLTFVMASGLSVDILGRVETFQTPLFTKEPQVDISLMCFDPDFVDPNVVTFSGMSTDTDLETLIEYPGTVETGLLFTIRPDRATTQFTIYNRPPDGNLRQLDFSIPLAAGDVLRINTRTGGKEILLTRDSTQSSALHGMSPQSDWIEFFPGDNYLSFYLEGVPIPFDIDYTTRYGGL